MLTVLQRVTIQTIRDLNEQAKEAVASARYEACPGMRESYPSTQEKIFSLTDQASVATVKALRLANALLED